MCNSYNLDNKDLKDLINKKESLIDSKELIDLRHLKTYTIDDTRTIEVDDAISIEIEGLKKYLWIHISNPAEFIEYGSSLDHIARDKAATCYINNEIYTMFPKNLVEQVLSLNSYKSNIALSVRVLLGSDGTIENYTISRTIIKPTYRLDYEEADEILDLHPKEEQDLIIINNELKKRIKFRSRQGSINLEEAYGKLLNDNGKIKHVIIEDNESRVLIKEAMLLYGSIIATHCLNNNILIPFRNQVNKNINTEDIRNKITNRHVANFVIKRKLARPTLDVICKGHSTIGTEAYVQATSPIRRYIDLITHIQVLKSMKEEKIINVEEITEVIYKYEKSNKQNNERIKSNKLINISLWFTSNKNTIWHTKFLTWLNKTRNIALIYFPILEMDIICLLHGNHYYQGHNIKLIFKKVHKESSLVVFEEN